MSVGGSLLFWTTERLRGTRTLDHLSSIRANVRLSTDAARSLQLELLRQLLRHAEQTVPYYGEVFKSLGATSDDVRSLADLEMLPVLTKDIVRERQDELLSRNFDRRSLRRLNSGGSTGVPLSFFHDANYLQLSDAATYRTLEQAGWRPGDMIAFFWGFNDRLNRMPVWEFEIRQRLRRMYQFDPFQADDATMAGWARKLRQIRPAVAYGYASTLARFAEFVVETREQVPRLRGVFTTAERLYSQQRTSMQEAFGCRVFDCYGSSEIRNIANECARGRMHVNVDFVVLELERSAATPDGVAPFLLTSLRSYGMPFIRYRNEDCGRLDTSSCTCGSGFPLMDLEIARVSDHFVFPGGRVVHGEFFTHLMYGSEGIGLFQFHQLSPERVNLYVVPTPGHEEGRRRTIDEAVRQIRALSSAPIQIDVQEVDMIPLSAAGKHRFTRSDVAASSARSSA